MAVDVNKMARSAQAALTLPPNVRAQSCSCGGNCGGKCNGSCPVPQPHAHNTNQPMTVTPMPVQPLWSTGPSMMDSAVCNPQVATRNKPFICTPCDTDFAVYATLLLDKNMRLVGSAVRQDGDAMVTTFTDPTTFLQGTADVTFASTFNCWALTQNVHATGSDPSPVALTPIRNVAPTSDHAYSLTGVTSKLIGAFLINFSRQQQLTESAMLTFRTHHLVGWSDTTSVVARVEQFKVPADVLSDGYALVGLAYRPPTHADSAIAYWCEHVRFDPLDPDPFHLRIDGVPSRVQTTVWPVVPGSIHARVASNAWMAAAKAIPVIGDMP